MKLSELLASVPDATTADSTDRDITSVIEGLEQLENNFQINLILDLIEWQELFVNV